MFAVSSSLLRIAETHDAERAAFSNILKGESSSFGDVVALAVRCRHAIARLGLRPGDTVVSDLDIGRDLAALTLACWESGLHLRIEPPSTAGQSRSVVRGAADLCVVEATTAASGRGARRISMAELGQANSTQRSADLIDSPAHATITAGTPGSVETMTSAALLQSAANFKAAFATGAGESLLSTASPVTLRLLCTSIVIPMALGLHAILANRGMYKNPASSDAAEEREIVCELPTSTWLAWLNDAALDPLPLPVRVAIANSSRMFSTDIACAEMALDHPVQHAYGTADTGFWAVVSPPRPQANYVASIRRLRSPLRLLGVDAACATGEVLLHPRTGDAPSIRTGDVGWMTASGGLRVSGKLSDVSVHDGQAILLTDVDRLVSSIATVRESRTFRENGLSPTEPAICVCVTEASGSYLREWLAGQGEPGLVPSRIIPVPPDACRNLPPVDTLRAIATGRAGKAVAAALTARRFRRNPAYDEAGLMAATDAALLSGRKLEFLMFWGCGPRRHAAAPDRAAIGALGELLAAAEAAAPVQACARIIFTDLHATNNGHSDAHFSSYFTDIRALACALDVGFELESAVWRRAGLSKSQVVAFEQTPEFQQHWQRFPLRSRFVEQASRHSGLADKTAAARHYYATCLLERDVLKASFAGSVFLTYNGPEFNECFPDLPTLYVYPGPRGRNDKPWFVDVDEQQGEHQAQVAAE